MRLKLWPESRLDQLERQLDDYKRNSRHLLLRLRRPTVYLVACRTGCFVISPLCKPNWRVARKTDGTAFVMASVLHFGVIFRWPLRLPFRW